MNTRHTALLAAALSAAACAALPAAEPATAQQMADLINQACALGRTCGKTYYPAAPPLKWNPLLEKAAAAHAQDMADKNYFRHESPDGRDMAGRVEQAGYRYRAVGENILAGEPTARTVIDTWLAPRPLQKHHGYSLHRSRHGLRRQPAFPIRRLLGAELRLVGEEVKNG